MSRRRMFSGFCFACGCQRGRGRSGGRAVSGRGRIRKRGPSGGGTLRKALPQQGQRPSSQNARVASARSQWPRASHCGLMHCTVKPGRNCISFSLSGRNAECVRPVARPGFPCDGRLIGADCCPAQTCCQEKRPQYIGVALPGHVRKLRWPLAGRVRDQCDERKARTSGRCQADMLR
jgi:hypothetical protein